MNSNEETGDGTEHCGTAGVKYILAHDLAAVVTQCFQYTNLGPLFINHTGHGGHADQCCHQEEENREDSGNTVHDGRITFKTCIAHVGIPSQNIGGRVFDIIDFLFGITELFACISNFFITVGNFFFCISDFRFCIGDFTAGIRQFFFTVFQLFFAIGNFFFRIGDFLFAIGNFFFRIGDFSFRISDFCLCLCKFRLSLGEFFFAVFQFLLSFFQFSAGIVQLFFCRRQLLLDGGFLCVVLFLRQVTGCQCLIQTGIGVLTLPVQLVTAICILIPAFFPFFPALFQLSTSFFQLNPCVLQLNTAFFQFFFSVFQFNAAFFKFFLSIYQLDFRVLQLLTVFLKFFQAIRQFFFSVLQLNTAFFQLFFTIFQLGCSLINLFLCVSQGFPGILNDHIIAALPAFFQCSFQTVFHNCIIGNIFVGENGIIFCKIYVNLSIYITVPTVIRQVTEA